MVKQQNLSQAQAITNLEILWKTSLSIKYKGDIEGNSDQLKQEVRTNTLFQQISQDLEAMTQNSSLIRNLNMPYLSPVLIEKESLSLMQIRLLDHTV